MLKETSVIIDKKGWQVYKVGVGKGRVNFGKKSALEKPHKFELSWSR